MKLNYSSLISQFFILLFMTASCSSRIKHDILLSDVNIIDVRTGEIFKNKFVGIDSNRITRIHDKADRISKKTRIVDGKEKYLIPGLWDMHNHCYDENMLGLFVANGVTGTRQMWGDSRHLKWRGKIKRQELLGPRLVVGSPIIDGPNSYMEDFILIDSISEISGLVSLIKDLGYDFVKIVSYLPADYFQSLADECRTQDIQIAGHVPFAVDPASAAQAGLRSHEHIQTYLYFCYMRSDEFRNSLDSILHVAESFDEIQGYFSMNTYEAFSGFDTLVVDSVITCLYQFNHWQCPTLLIQKGDMYVDQQMFVGDKRMAYLPKHKHAKGTADGSPQRLVDFLNLAYWNSIDILKRMNKIKIPIIAGTDVYFPGFALHEELELLVKDADLTPLEALQAATINAAAYLDDLENLGSIEEGKLADLVLLNANPLSDIKNTQTINAVIFNGILLDEFKLDSILLEYKKIGTKEPVSDTLLAIIDQDGIEQAISFYHELNIKSDSSFYFNYDQLNLVGYDLLRKTLYADAIDIFKLNIEEYPDNYMLHHSLAQAYEKSGQTEKAIEYYTNTIELHPLFISAKKKITELRDM